MKEKAIVAIWDDGHKESTDEEQSHKVPNLTLMVIGDESFDELDDVKDFSSYDELFETFKELHDDLKEIRLKNRSLKKKNLEFSYENDFFK